MGRYKKIKHVGYEKNNAYDEYKITSDDVKYLLPILKEVIKKVYPPVWMPIETAYFIYEHSEEIIGILNCDDSNERIELIKKIFMSEAVQFVVNYIIKYCSEDFINSLSDDFSSSVKEDSKKELAKKLTQGTFDGIAESVSEKISDVIMKEGDENE